MDLLTAFAATGPIGLILGFVLLRLESRMLRVEIAIDRLTRSILVDMLSRPDTRPDSRRQAERVLAELDAKGVGG